MMGWDFSFLSFCARSNCGYLVLAPLTDTHRADKTFRIVRNMQGRGRDCTELGECDAVGGNDDDLIRGSAGCGFSQQIDRARGLFERITMINVRLSSQLLISCVVYSVLNRIVWSKLGVARHSNSRGRRFPGGLATIQCTGLFKVPNREIGENCNVGIFSRGVS
ncbi:hypothetical protein BGZ61DRAFT_68221 [Ilyonectria robusta]|uniref:uncharacterized protein n=1 Tax=Ilyonectria robusta TaxID=1079257 RepID=UPI001E8D441E|nr:uncharacterized protein BGZ61DRAFT_68221 [Ilyonectria robusta]KAH8679141.1 hypothetical protein BGZ61DRAFT_68221 [Ilyonectria robusta]